MTNATKAVLGNLVTAGLALAVAFGLNLTGEQTAAITAFADTLFTAYVLLTHKDSPKRLPDGPTTTHIPA